MARFDSVYAICYNSAESEPIWMKSGTHWVHCLGLAGLALADFGRDPSSSESGRARRSFVFFCQVNNARLYRFPVAKFREIWTQHVHRCRDESFRNRILKFPRKGSFVEKRKIFAKNFDVLRLQAAIGPNSATIMDRQKSLPNGPSAGYLITILPLESIQSHSRGLYSPHVTETTPSQKLFYDVHTARLHGMLLISQIPLR